MALPLRSDPSFSRCASAHSHACPRNAPLEPDSQRGHHLTEREVYEFMARVPAGELAAEIIGRVRLTLHWVKEEGRG